MYTHSYINWDFYVPLTGFSSDFTNLDVFKSDWCSEYKNN